MIPLLVKHYWKAITLEEIPALREDDGAAASLGAFRAFTAARDVAYAAKHKGEKRKRNLALDFVIFFSKEARLQAVSGNDTFPHSPNRIDNPTAMGGGLHLPAIFTSDRSSTAA